MMPSLRLSSMRCACHGKEDEVPWRCARSELHFTPVMFQANGVQWVRVIQCRIFDKTDAGRTDISQSVSSIHFSRRWGARSEAHFSAQ